jgi:hypothetical protein
MGQNLPSNNRESLVWLEGIIATWNANYASIGLTSAQTIDLSQDVANTRSAFTTVSDIRTESKAKTLDANAKAKALHAKASAMISTIKGFARASSDPAAVYLASGISPADPPSPVGLPEQPSGLSAILGGDGSITIGFEGRSAVGTVWEVSRKLPGETSFTKIGNADVLTKSFTDTTVPGTVNSAEYRVQGIRGSDAGPVSLAFTVQFGSAAAAAASQAA